MTAFYDEEKSEIVFSGGHRFYCNGCIVGLSPDLGVYGGYDQSISLWPDVDYTEDEKPYSSPQECIDLADLMIERWQAYRARAVAGVKE